MSGSDQIFVFDRALVRRHRDRAAAGFAHHDALFKETAGHLLERLGDIKRNFSSILDLGAHNGTPAAELARRYSAFVVAADISENMLRESAPYPVVTDEEFLPFAANSFDLIVSNLSLHWVNDLPGALVQIKTALRPDGLFLAAILGGETLHELRANLMEAELAVTGGASMRLSPRLDLPAASGLLQRAGFALPVVDQEKITFTYPDAFALMHDLRGMGETNAGLQRLKRPTRRAVLFEAARLYQTRFAAADGRIPATFEAIFMHGWRS
jgi:NADH dehydrogenase [ubiquinone] 1 alpha subcomplex assembly factor 5